MRSKSTVYDELLQHQADLSFDLESPFYQTCLRWREARNVLDFGSGNGYYARKIAEHYPGKFITCVEIDPELADIARQRTRDCHARVITGSYTDVNTHEPFDFVIARHVLSYLTGTEKASFAEWISTHTSHAAGVLVVDADDEAFFVYPTLPRLEAGNDDFKERVHEKGGNRNLVEDVQPLWMVHGFLHNRTTRLVVHSNIHGRRQAMYSFMRSVAEYDHGSPIPENVHAELESWISTTDSYLQFGLFGATFIRGN